ncbi:MAG TPA: AmmeMemoRadiSam system radical SAM enzyme [Chloroflexi bacterium]|nr:AmmeMemoRadiSam system radical SAM enzyme [Chloroflexota bacterium]
MTTLGDLLDSLTVEGKLYETLEDGSVRCLACGHRCVIKPGRRGVCQVRFNRDGKLMVPWGYVAGLQADPIEKKPFYHFMPGSDALTFGMLGCDMHCSFCQNWLTSQALRDPAADIAGRFIRRTTPEEIIQAALRAGASTIASSYNEPLISIEWAVDIFRLAKQHGLKTVFVSNGHATPEALAFLKPWLDGYKVDLKTMNPREYHKLGGNLNRVLDTIRAAHEMGFWVEVVTLVIPGYNDSVDMLMDAARFIASVSPNIPWHVTAFHPDYKMTEPPPTSVETLIRAAEIGQEAGLHFVYAGNLPGHVGEYEHTLCPHCGAPLIKRWGYIIEAYHITAEGTCPRCGKPVPGVWPDDPAKVRLGGPGRPRLVW